MSKEYWYCIIGPVERDDLPHGSDFPLRLGYGRRRKRGNWKGYVEAFL